jgi:uroporphyrin-III C-methyltransferase
MVGKYRPNVNWSAIAQGAETIVIYMGIHNLGHIQQSLLSAGLSGSTPIALVRWGTTAQQEELIGSLETILDQIKQTGFETPAIAVIGNVVNFRQVVLNQVE